MYRRGFETLLLEAVDEQLTSLGESSKQALYFHLEKGFNIRKDEIPYKTEAFVTAMEKIFGLGADYLEILIMRSLHDKIGERVDLDRTTLTFLEYVKAAKRSYNEKKKAGRGELKRCQQVRVKC